MKKLKYSPDAREKLKQIKQYVAQKFGADTAGKVIKEMTKSIRDLQRFEEKGVSVESVLGIPCDYRMLYVRHNYVFYQIEADTIKITDIYNEREDFMRKLFGIKTTTEEAENYWKD
ncbi:MAG: type II toxin-antitoxin system RelE/ParE family toxin [Butyrivibrio sp.]|nr:type II toxin-antitoxin system RelE/ParE family toxin [Acetatifactor muris]MCM1560164.1 type II toxin-antitoxin system RelE/ParE family toxin [Butyrivibrio sp.]